MNNEKIAKIAREAVKIYFDFNCTPKQALETAKYLYKSNEMQVEATNRCLENFLKAKEVLK